MYTLLLIVIYLAFISLGLPDSLLGSGWPAMYPDLGVPLSNMGILTMLISGGTIVASLLSARLTRKFSTRAVTLASAFLTALALLGFSFSRQFWQLVLWALPYGLGAGAIDAGLNNYVALHYSPKHMSWLHCFWGLGALVSPFVMSRALRNASWSRGYFLIALVQFGIVLVLALSLPLWKRHSDRTEDGEAGAVGIREALQIRGVPHMLLAFFAYSSAEAIALGWTSTYLVTAVGLQTDRAAAYASLFCMGLTSGRFIGGFLMGRLGDQNMIRLGLSIILLGTLLLFAAGGTLTLIIGGLFLLGLGCAPIYPCIIHATPSNFGAKNSAAIIGIQMASAYIGSTFISPLFGLVGGAVGLWIMPPCFLLFFLLTLLMSERCFRLTAAPCQAKSGTGAHGRSLSE